MKPISNFHQHSTGSDGRLSPKQVVEQAIDAGLKYLCFTDHYPMAPGIHLGDIGFHSEDYKKEVEKLRAMYANKIKIFFGAEFEWIERYSAYPEYLKKEIKKFDYDYVLGSVHRILLEDGSIYPVNWNKEHFNEFIFKMGGIQNAVKEYYRQIKNMVKSGLFDCVGHLDVIKNINVNSCLFSDSEEWYTDEISSVLDEIAKSGMCMEINSSGLGYEVGEMYPSKKILIEAFKKNIPITIGSDGHTFVTKGLAEAFDAAKEAGYTSVFIFDKRKRIEINLNN